MFTTILLLVIGFSILTISLSAAGIIPMTMAASVTYSVFLIVVTLIQFLAHKYLKIRNKKTVKKTLQFFVSFLLFWYGFAHPHHGIIKPDPEKQADDLQIPVFVSRKGLWVRPLCFCHAIQDDG